MLIENFALLILILFVMVSVAIWVRFFHGPAWLRVQARLDELETNTSKLTQELEKRTQTDAAGFADYLPLALGEPTTGMLNLTKRTQALRLIREGQTSDQVARRLHVSRGEVELMVKISQLYVS